MDLRIILFKHGIYAVDMIVMTVREQDIGNAHAVTISQRQHLGDFPGRIDHGRAATFVVMYQVDKVFHRTQFQGVNGKRGNIRHGILHV